MPYGAFALTVTAPPFAPFPPDGLTAELVGDGVGELAGVAVDGEDEGAPIVAGTEVAFVAAIFCWALLPAADFFGLGWGVAGG
jgi:hypothetical protein